MIYNLFALIRKELRPKNYIKEIISGGQTGAERAAWDCAREEYKIPQGGWCPHGRKAEDGVISDKYNLKQITFMPADASVKEHDKKRIELNVIDSDGSLVFIKGNPTQNTLHAIDMLKKYDKPYFVFNIADHYSITPIVNWVLANSIHKLNVTGPSASEVPEMYNFVRDVLRSLLDHKWLNQYNPGNDINPLRAKL